MTSLVTAANRIMSTVAVSALVFMFCLIFGNVVLRFGFSTGISFAEELARYAFLWCTFIGAVLALGQNAHIGITGIRPRLPRRALWAFDAVVILIQLVITAIVLVGSVGILVANVGGQAPVSGCAGHHRIRGAGHRGAGDPPRLRRAPVAHRQAPRSALDSWRRRHLFN